MPNDPLIRAAVTKTAFAHIRKLPSSTRDEAFAKMPAQTVRDVDAATPVGWLPVRRHLDVVDVLHELMGAPGLQSLFCDVYLDGFAEMPAVRSLVNATLRLLAHEPTSLAKNLGRAWASLSRGLGGFEAPIVTGQRAFEIRYSGFPDVMADCESWPLTFAGVLDGFVRQQALSGAPTATRVDWNDRRVEYRVAWD